MKTNKTIELTELYSAPKCKVVKTLINRAIMAVSGGDSFSVDPFDEEEWTNN